MDKASGLVINQRWGSQLHRINTNDYLHQSATTLNPVQMTILQFLEKHWADWPGLQIPNITTGHTEVSLIRGVTTLQQTELKVSVTTIVVMDATGALHSLVLGTF